MNNSTTSVTELRPFQCNAPTIFRDFCSRFLAAPSNMGPRPMNFTAGTRDTVFPPYTAGPGLGGLDVKENVAGGFIIFN